MCFESENLDEYVNDLIEKGIEFYEKPTGKSWLWREARLKDLDGNQLILFHGGKIELIHLGEYKILQTIPCIKHS